VILAIVAATVASLSVISLPISDSGSSLTPAAAVPGQPGVPSDGTVVFRENFSEAVGVDPTDLRDYVGTDGMTYSADTDWLPGSQACNGWIMNRLSSLPAFTDSDGCDRGSAWMVLGNLAAALGEAQGMTEAQADRNKVLTAYTNSSSGNQNPGIAIKNNSQIQVEDGHFYAASAMFAASYCWFPQAQHPAFQFILIADGTERVIATGLDPCTGGDVYGAEGDITVDELFSDAYLVHDRDRPFGFEISNQTANGNGNDVALDIPTIIDVTPQLDKSFTPETAPIGGTARLSFTITNTIDLKMKQGWSFVDTLSAGLIVADQPNLVSTCPSTVVNAPAGNSAIEVVTGTIAAGQVSCTISIDVTSTSSDPRTFWNCAANFTELNGMEIPECATVEFENSSLQVQTSVPSGRTLPEDQFRVRAYEYISGTGGVETDALGPGVTTIGSAAGIQAQKFGPVEITAGQKYFVEQVHVPGTSRLHYDTTLSCTATVSGVETALLTTSTFQETAAGQRGAILTAPDAVRDIVCTFVNTPRASVIIIQKFDRDLYNPARPISGRLNGAQFQLWKDVDFDGQLDKSIDSEVDGVRTTANDPFVGMIRYLNDIEYGAPYILEEVQPPLGYGYMNADHWILLEWDYTISTELLANVTDPKLTFTEGSVTWEKIDASAPIQHLGSSQWRLNGPAGAQINVTDCEVAPATTCPASVNDEDPRKGYFSVTLPSEGTWSLTETAAPPGYQLSAMSRIFSISSDDPDYVFAMPITNVVAGFPGIPLTGGLGETVFLIGGGAAAVALITLLVIRRRQYDQRRGVLTNPGATL